MNKVEAEIRYLCVEANRVYNFMKAVKESAGQLAVVPNLSYGLVAINPIISRLRAEGIQLQLSKVGSSEAHGDSLVMGNRLLRLEELPDSQPSFVVVDGTKNTGGNDNSNNKYPDSQQGYLNFAVALNDVITSDDINAYRRQMGISSEHVRRLRDSGNYQIQKNLLETRLGSAKPKQPYAFKYWNPAGLTLALYNHGQGCDTSASSFPESRLRSKIEPTIFFINSAMPDKYHDPKHRKLWGEHHAAYFDDDGAAKNFQFYFDGRGVFLASGLGSRVQQVYEELYGDKPAQTGGKDEQK
jgi:hypothetical protein